MRSRWRYGLLLTAALSAGCASTFSKDGEKRDPFFMSHLTHSKEDPLFAATENAAAIDSDFAPVQAASIAKKTPVVQTGGSATAPTTTTTVNTPANASVGHDYRWIRGRVSNQSGKRPGWYLRYASSVSRDPYQGELMLESDPRLHLLREGDRIYAEGKVVETGPGERVYRVTTMSKLAP